MIQLLLNKTTPHFQLLPMSKVDHSRLAMTWHHATIQNGTQTADFFQELRKFHRLPSWSIGDVGPTRCAQMMNLG